MEKEYENVLVKTPRYKRMLWTMTIMIAGICIIMVALSYFAIENAKDKLTAEKYQEEKAKLKVFIIQQVILTVGVIVFMFGISNIKRRTRIKTSPLGIEYSNIFKKVFIPWEQVKDVKVKMPGTSLEKCVVKGTEDRSITFNAYMLDTSINYRFEKDAILDEHGTAITGEIRKSRLYKEVIRMYEKVARTGRRVKEEIGDR